MLFKCENDSPSYNCLSVKLENIDVLFLLLINIKQNFKAFFLSQREGLLFKAQ